MSNGRSEESEGDFNEISLDHPNESSQSDQLNPNSDQNLSPSEIKNSSEDNRNNSNAHLDESENTHYAAKSDTESTDLHSTQTQTKLESSIKDTIFQVSNYHYTYEDELREIRSPENTSRYGPTPNLNNFENFSHYIENFNSHDLKIDNNTEDDYKVEQKLDYGFQNIHTHHQYESNIVYRHEHKLMEEDSEDQLSESRGYMQGSNIDHLNEEPVEYDLSDQQSPEQLSEPGAEGGFSDIDLNPDPEAKLKHRKKFKTSKTLESIFHKSSTGKYTKSSKHKATPVPTSPSTKENVVVTTSTSSMSGTKKKDKNPSWTNYEIPSKPSRKGPTLGVFYDSVKSSKSHQKAEGGKENKCIVLQTPDSIERYIHPFQVVSNYYQNNNYIKYYNSNVGNEDGLMNNYYFINMMAQRKSLLPYYVTKSIFGNVPGMGRVLVCGTQCGKIIFYSFFSLDELLVLDTRSVYDNYLSRDNSIDSESGCDMNKAIDSTLFEINCLSFISTFHNYSSHLAIGNHLGHLLLYQIPKLQLVKLIYPPNLSATTSFTPNNNLNTFSSVHSYNTYNTFSSYDSINTDTDDVLIDELELMKIRRYKNTIRANRGEKTSVSDNGDDLGGLSSDDDDVVFISCLGFCSATGDLWVGYGNGNFAIYSYKFKLKYFYNPNHLSEGSTSNIIVDQTVYSVNNFEFCNHEHIVLVLYGNVKVDIFSFEGTFLSTISATRLTNSSIPISTINVSNTHNNSTILYIGLMDGSLLIKQILYTTNGSTSGTSPSKENKASGVNDDDDVLVELLSNSIEFILLYNLRYNIDGELNFGAPITSICPVPSQNLVLLGNASGGLSVISNLDY